MSAEMSAPPAPVRYARTRWIPRGIGLLLLAGGLCTAWLYFRREEHVPRGIQRVRA